MWGFGAIVVQFAHFKLADDQHLIHARRGSFKVSRCAKSHDPHPVHDRHPAAKDLNFVHVVSDQDDRGTLLAAQVLEVVPDGCARERVQADGRLIQENSTRGRCNADCALSNRRIIPVATA